MITLRKLTTHQINAAYALRLEFEMVSGSSIEIHGFDSADVLANELEMRRDVVLHHGDMSNDALFRWEPEINTTQESAIRRARRGLLTASASLVRAARAKAKVDNDPEQRKLAEIAAAKKATDRAIAKAAKAQEAKKERRDSGADCQCGCGGRTAGGRFLPGHDAKLKSQLVKSALDGDSAAVDRLESLGWTKFLDKAREKASRPRNEVRVRRQQDDAERAAEKLARLALMKEALEVLKSQDRASRNDDGYVEVTAENAAAIIAGEL